MWDMAKTSIVLFFRGKLFADSAKVYRQLAIGIAVTALVLIVAAKLGMPIWLSAMLAGLGGGVLQPYLFKDLRYS